MIGGATGGNSAIGNASRLTPPASVITIEITDAKIGRWMKNREITALGCLAGAASPRQTMPRAGQWRVARPAGRRLAAVRWWVRR